MPFGKLTPAGVLSNIGFTAPFVVNPDVVVVVDVIPSGSGPFAYDAINHLAISNPTQAAIDASAQNAALIASFSGQDVRMRLAADAISTVVAFADVPGISFPIGVNEIWGGSVDLYCLGAAAGMRFQLTGPASPVNAVIAFDGHTTSKLVARAYNDIGSVAYSVPSMAYIVNATPFSGQVRITFDIANGPNAGTVKIQFASLTAGQTTKVLKGSNGRAWRAA